MHTEDEKHLLPYHSALGLQWMRTVWIVHMWAQSGSCQRITVLIPEHYGWTKLEGTGYTFQWDTEEQVMAIRNKVCKYTKGCKCIKNGCKTKQCCCKQKGQTCGPGCQCINCENLLPEISRNKQISLSPAQPLYYPEDLEPSLLKGEEIELKESSDTSDTDSNGDISTDKDIDSIATDVDFCN